MPSTLNLEIYNKFVVSDILYTFCWTHTVFLDLRNTYLVISKIDFCQDHECFVYLITRTRNNSQYERLLFITSQIFDDDQLERVIRGSFSFLMINS